MQNIEQIHMRYTVNNHIVNVYLNTFFNAVSMGNKKYSDFHLMMSLENT